MHSSKPSNRKLMLNLGLKLSLSLSLSLSLFAQEKSATSENIAAGKAIYTNKCVHCHGVEGKGDGPAAERLSPRPRDFTRGKFKIRSTESRELPTDDDLFKIITDGMPGTSMPAWNSLSEDDRRNVVTYIKTFSRRFEQAETPHKKINLKNPVSTSAESVAKGRQVYEEIECFKCHGQEGRGNGTSALSLVDEWNNPILPADLTESWTFRGGSSVEEIYKRFIAGLDGTPMPSIVAGFPMDEEIDEIQIKLEDEEEVTAEEREKLDAAMEEIRLKSWHLANYVRSLAPEEKPEVKVVLKSVLVEGELPQEIDDPRWDDLESNMYPLVGQVIIEPRNFTPSVDAVFVKSMYNENEIAFLLAWDDPSFSVASGNKVFDDAMALQFPVKLSQGSARPYFLMGDARKAVYLWHWNSFSSDSLLREDRNFVEKNAKGLANFEKQPLESQSVYTRVSYSNGRYQLLARRALSTDNKKDLQFEVGRFTPIAFFTWDGSNAETGTKCSVSTWYYLLLEKPASQKRFLFAPIAAVLAVFFQVIVMRNVRRREKK